MAQTLTRDFAMIDYDPQTAIDFPQGLPGFGDERRFLLIEKESLAPLVFLQSLMTPELCFLTVSVFVAEPGYQIGNLQEDYEIVTPGTDSLWLAILAASPIGFSANLLAPVVVNLKTREAVQAVRSDALYSHQHPLPWRVDEAACS